MSDWCYVVSASQITSSVTPSWLSSERESMNVSAEAVSNVSGSLSAQMCRAELHYFHIASFIGGMVFAFGIVAILCFLFQAQREHNYHTR